MPSADSGPGRYRPGRQNTGGAGIRDYRGSYLAVAPTLQTGDAASDGAADGMRRTGCPGSARGITALRFRR